MKGNISRDLKADVCKSFDTIILVKLSLAKSVIMNSCSLWPTECGFCFCANLVHCLSELKKQFTLNVIV